MNLLQSIIYGMISGVSQFLPVPSSANQAILLKLFGISHRDHLCDAIVHICILIALIWGARNVLEQMRYDSRRRDSRYARNANGIAEWRFTKNASYCTVLLLISFSWWVGPEINYLLVSLFLIINGLLLFIPSRMYQGNKDARSMSLLDSVLIGSGNALSAVPGFSGAGCCLSFASMRGVDRRHAVNWLLMLSLPKLVVLIGTDIAFLISNWNAIAFGGVFGYFLAGISACVSGYFGIILLKMLVNRTGIHEFAFYSWGLALLMLIMFLI